MWKLLIVDDEPIEREGLQKIIELEVANVRVVGQAGNGREAIELVHQLEPDLVMMDIKMPGMDGLEAAEQMKKIRPEICIMMLSAHDTFTYAQQAIRLGVKDYILKPSKVFEIVKTVNQAIEEMARERLTEENRIKSENKSRWLEPVAESELVFQLLYGHVHELNTQELIGLLQDDRQAQFQQGFVIVMYVIPKQEMDNFMRENLYKMAKAWFKEHAQGWTGAMIADKMPFIVMIDPNRSYRAQAVQMIRRLLPLERFLPNGRLFFGAGSVCSQLRDLRKSYQEALLTSGDDHLPVNYQLYEDREDRVQAMLRFEQQEEQALIEAIQKGDFPFVKQRLIQYMNQCEATGMAIHITQQHVLEMLFVFYRLLSEIGVQMPKPLYSRSVPDYPQCIVETASILKQMEDVYYEQKRHQSDPLIDLKQYITRHAHESITLEQISERFDLNPFVASKLFKERFGMNYIDYLTSCRMDKAKMLMHEAKKSIKEIAFEVGYHDPNYFSRVFKKVCGVSAKEYRRQLFHTSEKWK